MEALWDTKKTAEVTGISPATLETWRSTGRYNLKFCKIGNRVRYRPSDVMAFIESRMNGPAAC